MLVLSAFLAGLSAAGPLDGRHPALQAITALGSAQMAAHAGLRGESASRAWIVFLDDEAGAEADLAGLLGADGGLRRDPGWRFAGSWLVHAPAAAPDTIEALRAATGVRLVLPRPALGLCI